MIKTVIGFTVIVMVLLVVGFYCLASSYPLAWAFYFVLVVLPVVGFYVWAMLTRR